MEIRWVFTGIGQPVTCGAWRASLQNIPFVFKSRLKTFLSRKVLQLEHTTDCHQRLWSHGHMALYFTHMFTIINIIIIRRMRQLCCFCWTPKPNRFSARGPSARPPINRLALCICQSLRKPHLYFPCCNTRGWCTGDGYSVYNCIWPHKPKVHLARHVTSRLDTTRHF